MKPITDVKQSVIIKPIDPNLDITALDEIEKREEINTMNTVAPLAEEASPSVITP